MKGKSFWRYHSRFMNIKRHYVTWDGWLDISKRTAFGSFIKMVSDK